MLQRTGTIIIGITDILAAARGLKLDLGSGQAVTERLLSLRRDPRVPLGPFNGYRRLVSRRRKRFGTCERRCRFDHGSLRGRNLRPQVMRPLLELPYASCLERARLPGDLLVNFLQSRETLRNARPLRFGLVQQPLQIIQPTAIGPAIGDMDYEPAPCNCRSDCWCKVLDLAVDGGAQRDKT